MFIEELNYISDSRIRESAKILLEGLPDYFYTILANIIRILLVVKVD